jgi:hypothetical protein
MSTYKINFMRPVHLLVIMFLMLAGCKKETEKLSSDIQGTWELVSMDGGWFGHQEYTPGNGNTLSFNGNNYSQTIKTTDTTYRYSGTFSIYTDKPCGLADEQTLIKFNDNEVPATFALSDGKLIIGATQCIADGTISTYRKIK